MSVTDTNSLWDGIEGIVLDAVGTLIDPSPPVSEVYLAAAARQGVVVSEADVRAQFGRYFRDDEVDETRGPLVTDESIEFARWRRIVSQVLPELPDPDRGFAELWAHFGRADAWRCAPDLVEALRLWKGAGLRVCIASNFDSRLRGVLAGIDELGDVRDRPVISSEIGFRKPHPAFYAAACGRLGLPPGRVLCIGDDEENDLKGPVRAGLRAALVDRSGGNGAAAAGVFRALSDVVPGSGPAASRL